MNSYEKCSQDTPVKEIYVLVIFKYTKRNNTVFNRNNTVFSSSSLSAKKVQGIVQSGPLLGQLDALSQQNGRNAQGAAGGTDGDQTVSDWTARASATVRPNKTHALVVAQHHRTKVNVRALDTEGDDRWRWFWRWFQSVGAIGGSGGGPA